MSSINNIVLNTLLSKIRDLEAEDLKVDQEYSKNKRRIKADIEQLKYAVMQHRKDMPLLQKVGQSMLNRPGRKAQEFDPLNYPYTGSVKNKMLFAINDMKRFLHVREIADYIIDREPTNDRQALIDNLGRHIYKYKKDGVISAIKIGSSHRNTFYGLPAWVDEFGKPKEGYGYNTDAMIDKIYGDFDLINTQLMNNLFNQNTTPSEDGAKIVTEDK